MMIENLFVLSILILSGGYVVQRLLKMQQAFKRRESACGSCASACTPQTQTEGEISLPMH